MFTKPNNPSKLISFSGQGWEYDIPQVSERLVSFSEVMSHLEDRMEMDSVQNPTNPMSIIGFSNEVSSS